MNLIEIQGTGKPFVKLDKSENKFFVKLPSDLMYYVHVPGYKPEYNYLYAIIVDFYNVEYGYSYPTEWQIARLYGRFDPKTVRAHLRGLERVGLIGIYKPRRNKIYVPFLPLTQDELFAVCPEAKKHYEDHVRKEDEDIGRQSLEELPPFLQEKFKERFRRG